MALGPKDLENLAKQGIEGKIVILVKIIDGELLGSGEIHPEYTHYVKLDGEINGKGIRNDDLKQIVQLYKKAGWKRVEYQYVANGGGFSLMFIP